jgi:phenylacetate-CoA ligase
LNYQNSKVREIVKYAFDYAPFYHEKFLELGIKPDDVKSVRDLNKLPIIRREELQESSGKLISSEFDQSKLKVVSTSGSSGRPLFTYLTKREDAFRKAKLLRPHIVCGQKPWDRWVLIEPPQHHARVSGFQRMFNIYAPFSVSVFDSPAEQIAAIEKLRPDVLDGYSSSLFLLAKELENIDVKAIRPRFCMGGAELLDKSSCSFLERVLGAPYYDQYASEEFQMMAWQCPEKKEYHIDADSIIMQFVGKDGGDASAGEEGEIVCTSLFNHAMPILRYAVGDIGIPSEETPCACGRTFPLMKLLKGRQESIVVLPDGTSLSPLAIGDCMCAFKYFSNVYQYRFIQTKIDHFRILIEKKNESVSDKVMESELITHVRRVLGLRESEASIEVEFVDEIPPDRSGKIRKVVSELRS